MPIEPQQETPAFSQLGLSATVMAAVEELGYSAPTPVQAGAIPEVLAGRDVLAAAQTGTGKTAAFLLPTMNNLDHANKRRVRGKGAGVGPFMLVVTPTRELAQQIEEACRAIAKQTHHSSVTVVGGVGYNPQRNALKQGCDILIATPGRLLDLMDQGAAQLDQVKVLVLDEADRMLDMGFLPAIRTIVAATPENRQTLLFSATLDESAVGSITNLVKDPARIEIAPATSTAESVEQYALPVSLEAKNGLLAQLLKQAGTERVIVFTRTKHRADACRKRLNRAGVSCAAIHGDRSQAQRERALKAFRDGEVDVLVATDVLARGIDITDVTYVVNFDVPEDPVDYIHRIGRTGRGGDVGWSLTIVTEQDIDEFHDIEALMGKTVELYDAGNLDLGENPVYIDPDRVPAAKVPSKKAKKKRRSAKRKVAQAKPNQRKSENYDAEVEAVRKELEAQERKKAKKQQPAKKAKPKAGKRKAMVEVPAAEAPKPKLRPGVHSSGIRDMVSSSGPAQGGNGKKSSRRKGGPGAAKKSGKPAGQGSKKGGSANKGGNANKGNSGNKGGANKGNRRRNAQRTAKPNRAKRS